MLLPYDKSMGFSRDGEGEVGTYRYSWRRFRIEFTKRFMQKTAMYDTVIFMEPQIGVITLGVDSLEQSLKFYCDGLGFPTKGIVATEFKGDDLNPSGAVVMFHLQGGLILALYPRTELAKDAKVSQEAPSATEFSIGYLTKSKEEVDSILQKAKVFGAIITDEPHDRPWGIYSGYFKDPDGHLWEIIWNPQM